MIDITPEGLRIQIIDNEGRSMFPSGSANMFPFMRALVQKVTQIIIPQKNQISVRGHTDGTPYPAGATYNNWNLSSDRAIASQRVMMDNGLDVNRIENVVGKADREHLLPDDPLSPRNRRISVILLREKLQSAEEIRQAAADAIRERQQELEAQQAEQQALEEDRENVPELDNTIDETPDPIDTFMENNLPSVEPEEELILEEDEISDDPIGDEIRKLQQQRDRQNRSPALPSPQNAPSLNDGDVLEF
jgi:hypothetical protein